MITCRSCKSNNLFTAISFGNMPIAGELLESNLHNSDLFSSDMLICKDCSLGQISEDIDRSRLFDYYRFRTSYSSTYLKHCRRFVSDCIYNIEINTDDWVLELASNDGYLLKMFKEKDINVLGVDPAKNISMYAICDGIPTIVDFFGKDLAKEILRIKGYPKLIVANNVLAHVPDINDFMEGISILCNDDTVVSIENPSIMNIINDDQFDTIYHEHYSYLSASFMDMLSKKYGMTLFNVENYPVHGGSNRYWISRKKEQLDVVTEIINNEKNNGISDEGVWKTYNLNIKNKLSLFNKKLIDIKNKGGTICGYTASAKGAVILSLAQVDGSTISVIADDSFEKQGKYMPGSKIPVVSIENMLLLKPTDIVVFSWNIYEEIKQKIISHGYNDAKIWIWDGEIE